MLIGVGMQRFLELKMFWVYSLEQSHKGIENLWQFLQNDLLKVFHLKKKKRTKLNIFIITGYLSVMH